MGKYLGWLNKLMVFELARCGKSLLSLCLNDLIITMSQSLKMGPHKKSITEKSHFKIVNPNKDSIY